MKSAVRNLIILAVALMTFNNAAAQKAAYTTNSGVTIGFGLGAAYQQSDIANSRGSGFDFSLGSYIYKKENAFLSVDWKFRFLGGINTAYDHRINPDDTYSNIHYEFFNYDLELGLALNRLRERTRILVSGFGGIGITNGITSADLLDAAGNPYNYSVIDPTLGRKEVYADLRDLSDKEFETNLVNKAALMPTLGVFLGYQFSRSFSLGIEHKINFSLSENNSSTGIDIDNKIVNGSKTDRNHYTSLGFTWILSGRSSRLARRNSSPAVTAPLTNPPIIPAATPVKPPVTTPVTTSVTSPVKPSVTTPVTTNNYNQVKPITNPVPAISVPPPAVEIVSPSGNNYTTTTASLDMIALMKNIKGKQNIQVVLNGENRGFEYDALYGNVSSTLALKEGRNILTVTGTNESGRASDDVTIYWNKPVQVVVLPYVKFIDPASPVNVERNVYSISVQTTNVKSWQDVTVTVNGTNTGNFNFSTDGKVTTNIPLNEGVNKVEVKGKNESGIASGLATITYKKPVNIVVPVTVIPTPDTTPCPAPVMTMTEPARNELLTDVSSCNIRIGIKNITTKEQISVLLNNRNITNYSFTGSEISFTASLNEGINNCIITATSNCGAQKIAYTLIYKPAEVIVEKPCQVPGVNFSISTLNREDATHALKGTVSNVTERSEIAVTVNDKSYEAFQYIENTGEISALFNFKPGSHNVKATVRNDCGRDEFSETIVVEEEKPCGVRINPGNSSWEFCLVTPSDTINRDRLTNNSFSYSGPASSLYFKPIGGGGDAVVKGKPYPLQPGQYYLFTGSLTVTVSTKNKGSMGQWSVCINAGREPVSGNGDNRPQSPCEEQEKEKKLNKGNELKNNK